MKRLIFILSIAFLFNSCDKEISLDLPDDVEQKIVIEGNIEQGSFPFISITKSVKYFAPTDSAMLATLVVKDAVVTISDGATTYKCIFIPFEPGSDFGFYSAFLQGEVGKTYDLKVEVGGHIYTSSTYIPAPVPLDSVWFQKEGSDTLGFVWGHLREPAGQGNSYRWFAKRLGKDDLFLPPLGSAFDDKFIDGRSFDFGYNRGRIPNSTAPDDTSAEAGYFKVGDTVIVKFTTLDHDAFEFFRTYEIEAHNNSNPFAAPAPIKTNIKGGALGVWVGYGVSLDTAIAK